MNRTAAVVVGLGTVVGILIAAGQFALIGLASYHPQPRVAAGAAQATKIQCSPLEALATHYHVALRIHETGMASVLPAGTGIEATCFYWIHVHDDSGIVHVEAPKTYSDHTFVLADVFAVAGMRFDAHHLGSRTFAGHSLSVYVEGNLWTGAPGDAPLEPLQTIDVVGPGQPFSYRPFGWPGGFLPPPTT